MFSWSLFFLMLTAVVLSAANIVMTVYLINMMENITKGGDTDTHS